MESVGITGRFYFQPSAYHMTAGTLRSAELRPELPACVLDPSSSQKVAKQPTNKKKETRPPESIPTDIYITNPESVVNDEFGDDDFKDLEVINASITTFLDPHYTRH